MPEISRFLGVVIQISGLIMLSETIGLRVQGQFREGTAPCETENHVIPAFLEMVFNQPDSIWAN